jgi:hypothetical protein
MKTIHLINKYLPKYSSTLVFILQGIFLCGQPVNTFNKSAHTNSPEAASFNKYVNIPVQQYTGVPNINVPIHTIQEGPLEVPIGMRFHAGGIRVDELSSWVGMGWHLDYGGSLSRTVQGLEDEGGLGYFTRNGLFTQNGDSGDPNAPFTLAEAATGKYDTEPDLFSFSVGGFSGKFFFDKNRVVRMHPQQDVKIVMPFNNFQKFLIILPNGLRYHFETFMEYHYTDVKRFPNRWMLRRIETADEKYFIQYNYTTEIYTKQVRGQKYHAYGFINLYGGVNNPASNVGCDGGGLNNTPMNYEISRLTQITTSSNIETVTFVPSANNREDVTGTKSLSKISVSTGSFCKEYVLTHDYAYAQSNATQANHKRLRLLSMQERSCDLTLSKPAYVFTYESGDAGNGLNSDGTFFMPAHLSKSIDHWGYYNAANNDAALTLTPPTDMIDHGGNAVVYGVADRVPKPIGKKGLLKKINYPEGGNTEFSYANNDYWGQSETPIVLASEFGPCVNASCCETNVKNLNWTFAANTNFNEIFIQTYGETKAYCGAPHNYQLKVYNSANTLLGAYSFTLPPQNPFTTGENSGARKKKITDIFTPSTGIAYRFELTLENMYGYVRLLRFPFTNVPGAGYRIQQVKTHDGISSANDIIVNYDYTIPTDPTRSSGSLLVAPKYGQSFVNVAQPYNVEQNDGSFYDQYLTLFYEQSYYPEANLDGVVHAYAHVKEIYPDNGSIAYNYTLDNPIFISDDVLPISLHQYTEFNGKLIARKVNEGTIENTNHQYDEFPRQYFSGYMVKALSLGFCQNHFPILVKNFTGQLYGAHVSLTFTNRIVDGVSTVTNYAYDGTYRHLMPISTTVTNSDLKVYKNEHTYVHDYTNVGGERDFLLGRNLIGEPFRTVQKVNNVQIDGMEHEYGWFNLATGTKTTSSVGSFLRKYDIRRYEKTFNTDGSLASGGGWDLQVRFNKYDAYGNVAQSTVKEWQPQDYEWFANGSLKKSTFISHSTDYLYYANTRLLSSLIEIDGQNRFFEYDPLMRLKKSVFRKIGSTEHVKTEYTYQYPDGSNPVGWIKNKTNFTPVANSLLTQKENNTYYDGLGRSIQEVAVQHAPNGTDVKQGTFYDNQGRPYFTTTPTVSTTTDGSMGLLSGFFPGSYTGYEASPLSRPISSTPPQWYATTVQYTKNSSNLTSPWGQLYLANSLIVHTTTDPDGKSTDTYTDKVGRTVLTIQRDMTDQVMTWTQYDDKNRVSKVYPPGSSASTPNLIFEYRYDVDDNLIYKKVPDAQAEEYQYNNRNLLAGMRNAILQSQGRWLVTQYDVYGRPTKRGYQNNTGTTITNPDNPTINTLLEEYFYDGFDGSSTLSDPIYKSKIRKSRIKVLEDAGANNLWTETTYTYDIHGRVQQENITNHLGTTEVNTYTYDSDDNILSHTHTVGAPYAVTDVRAYTYDHQGRKVFDKINIDGTGEKTIAEHKYNHRNELIEKNLGRHATTGTHQYLQSIDYQYNLQGWLTHINNLENNTLPSVANPCVTPFIPPTTATSTNTDDHDLFSQRLYYNLRPDGATYFSKNGNISAQAWYHRGIGQYNQSYTYDYDFLNRVKSGVHGEIITGTHTPKNQYNEVFTYDPRGNILSLHRKGMVQNRQISDLCYQPATIDSLTYEYVPQSNKLNKVTDKSPCLNELTLPDTINRDIIYAANQIIHVNTTTVKPNVTMELIAGDKVKIHNKLHLPKVNGLMALVTVKDQPCPDMKQSEGFNQQSEGNFVYDNAGNLTYDPNKKLTFLYNHLNLPYRVVGAENDEIHFLYSALGDLLQRTYFKNTIQISKRDYIKNKEYLGNQLEVVHHDDVRILKNQGNFTFEFKLKDHLQSVRAIFIDLNNDGFISQSEITQRNDFYAFGMGHKNYNLGSFSSNKENSYLYNQKELISDMNLNWTRFKYRFYNSDIGRFSNIDPISIKFT